MGEYPGYRFRRENWAPNLRELRGRSVDVVSFYLPRCFHEVNNGPTPRYDFTAATNPQRDVHALLAAAAEADPGVLTKPGPFIHLELTSQVDS
ncbi:beta-galactosidase [Streptomyces sp. NPDC051020]|uniref:beta-galactosidase n=1 Tax=Streptomyces sp. NPDC051020 TaxID=3155409 RepID=UPI003430D947